MYACICVCAQVVNNVVQGLWSVCLLGPGLPNFGVAAPGVRISRPHAVGMASWDKLSLCTAWQQERQLHLDSRDLGKLWACVRLGRDAILHGEGSVFKSSPHLKSQLI